MEIKTTQEIKEDSFAIGGSKTQEKILSWYEKKWVSLKDCLNSRNEILDDKDEFWINAVTKELNYKQRVIGKIKVEDGEIVSNVK